MQEQGKRLLLAAVIAVGVLFAWNAAFPTKKNPPKPVVAAGSGSAGGAPIAVTPQSYWLRQTWVGCWWVARVWMRMGGVVL